MKTFTRFAATATVAVLAFAAADLSASAQDLTNGPNGMRPNRLSSRTMMGRQPSRVMMRRHAMHAHMSMRYGHPLHPVRYAAVRPLVVRPAAPVVVAPAPVVAGPGTLVTGPLAFGSNIVALPFRGLESIFPATGTVATNPLVIIGAPLRAAADLAQVPFRIAAAPFGGVAAPAY